MHHPPGDKILLEVEMEQLRTFVNQLNGIDDVKIELHIHQDITKRSYTINKGFMPFIKKAFENHISTGGHKIIELYLNANKTLLYVIVKTKIGISSAKATNPPLQFAITHKLITNCIACF